MIKSERGAKITLIIFTVTVAAILHFALSNDRLAATGVSSETTASIPKDR